METWIRFNQETGKVEDYADLDFDDCEDGREIKDKILYHLLPLDDDEEDKGCWHESWFSYKRDGKEDITIERAINDYKKQKMMVGGCLCEIVTKTKINDTADLLICNYTEPVGSYGSATFAAIRYAGGVIFTVWDWEGDYPKTVEEIKDYKWRFEGTQQAAVMVDGLPRALV